MSILVTSAKFKSVRGSIEAALSKSLPRKVEVIQYPDFRPLRQFATGDRVSFALKAVEVLPDFAERERGGRVPVVPLLSASRFDTPQPWLGWYERWIKKDAEEYALTNVSATFFWGISNRSDKQQVLRAEWDSVDTAAKGSGQPHWQFDPTFRWVSSEWTQELRENVDCFDLVELPNDNDEEALFEYQPPTQELSLARMHLGMAGWHNGDKSSTWWKQSIPRQPALFAEWIERVIVHARDQFRLLSMKATA